MARKKKTGARPKTKAKAKPAKKETRRQPEVIEDTGEGDDPIALSIILLTAVCLVAAIIINMMHLADYGAGPFS